MGEPEGNPSVCHSRPRLGTRAVHCVRLHSGNLVALRMVDGGTRLPAAEMEPLYSAPNTSSAVEDHTSQHPRRNPGGGERGSPTCLSAAPFQLMTTRVIQDDSRIAVVSRDVRCQAHGLRFVDGVQALSSRFLTYSGTFAALLAGNPVKDFHG